MFFQRKHNLRSQWVLAYRLKRRSLNIAASSRVEGEFGVLNRLNMTGSMKFKTGISKMRFSASNRHRKKIARAERWCGTKVIRNPNCPISAADFRQLDNHLTPFYRNFVEKQITAAQKFLKAKVVEINGDDEIIFRVWSPTAHGDDDESGSDESNVSSDEGDLEPLSAPPQMTASYPEEEGYSDFHDPAEMEEGRNANDHALSAATNNFNWLRVRTVHAQYCAETQEWILKCSCGLLERICCPCRHTFCVTHLMTKNYGIKNLRFNRRCYKGFYHMVMCSKTDFFVDEGVDDVFPSIQKAGVDAWLACTPVASHDNVPREGLKDADDGDVGDGYNDEGDNGDITSANIKEPRQNDRPKRRNSDVGSIQHQVLGIIDLLGPVTVNVTGYNHFADHLKCYAEYLGRQPRLAIPGAGKKNRTLGVSDFGSSSVPLHSSKHSAAPHSSQSKYQAPIDHPALRTPSEEESAAAQLQKVIENDGGVEDGHYVEVFPKKGTPPTDRWFMKVVDGFMSGNKPNLSLRSCAWCQTNSLKLDRKLPIQSVEIRSIFATGMASKFEVPGSNGRVLPKVVRAAASDSAAPIKERAAAATKSKVISTDQILDFVRAITPVQEECTGDKFCICSKCR
jgi:hypothetical protein